MELRVIKLHTFPAYASMRTANTAAILRVGFWTTVRQAAAVAAAAALEVLLVGTVDVDLAEPTTDCQGERDDPQIGCRGALLGPPKAQEPLQEP